MYPFGHIMSRRLVAAIPDEHYAWLEDVRTKKGLESVQDALRAVIADSYSQEKRKPKPNWKKQEVSEKKDESALD